MALMQLQHHQQQLLLQPLRMPRLQQHLVAKTRLRRLDDAVAWVPLSGCCALRLRVGQLLLATTARVVAMTTMGKVKRLQQQQFLQLRRQHQWFRHSLGLARTAPL